VNEQKNEQKETRGNKRRERKETKEQKGAGAFPGTKAFLQERLKRSGAS
jgi:hypothetical protein